MEGLNSTTLKIHVTSSICRDNDESNIGSNASPSSRNVSSSPRGSLLESGSSQIARSNSMRTSRWDESMPKHLEPRPPTRPVRKTISRSLSPRPRKPISLASLRPPPPSPTWSGVQGGAGSQTMLLPTRSPTPPQVTGYNSTSSPLSKPTPIHINVNSKHLETFSSTGWSSAPTTPTSIRKTLDVPGRMGSGGGDMLKKNCFIRSDRSGSSSPTRDSTNGGSSRIPRIESHLRCLPRTDSKSPSRYLDNLSSRQKRGESPVIIYDKKSDKYTSPLILDIRKKQEAEEKNIGGVKLSNLTPPTNRKLGSSSHDAASNKGTERGISGSKLHSETKAMSTSASYPRTVKKCDVTIKPTSNLTPPTIRKIGASSTKPTSPSTARKVPSGSNSRPSTPTTISSPSLQITSSSASSSATNLYVAPSPKSPSLVRKLDRSSGRIRNLRIYIHTKPTKQRQNWRL